MKEKLIYTTLIKNGTGTVLDPKIVVETWAEDHGAYYFLFSRAVVTLGEPHYTERTYLRGTYKGLKQTVNVELSAALIETVGENYHKVMVLGFTAGIPNLILNTLKSLLA